MPTPPVIVVYGHDQSLLDTRTWVLEGAGYEVSQASDIGELEQAACERSVKLVVLCHTLTEQECEATRTSLEERQPATQRLLITTNRPLFSQTAREPAISAFDGPRALIEIVGKLLSTKD